MTLELLQLEAEALSPVLAPSHAKIAGAARNAATAITIQMKANFLILSPPDVVLWVIGFSIYFNLIQI